MRESSSSLYTFLLLLFIAVVHGRVFYNPQLNPPYSIHMADLTGDSIYDFHIIDGDKVYVASTEFNVHGYSYAKLPAAINRTITGRFAGGSKEYLCAQEPSLSRLDCYALDSTNTQLLWYWYQPDFIGSNLPVVGDFNGDGTDDILVYTPSSGTFQMYKRNPSTWYFEVQSDWVPGDISGAGLVNLQVRAGRFGSTDVRTDLLFYSPSIGRAWVYESVYDSSSHKNTFWWYFTTATGWGYTNEEILVADMDGDGMEEVILHNTVTGSYYVSESVYDPTYSMVPSSVDTGDLHSGTNSRAFFGKFKIAPAGEDGGKSNLRDDGLVYSYDWNLWVRSDARYTTQQTYVWVYTQYPLILNQDQDGDAIKTKHELGGYDPNNDGVSDTPLHTYGASPFFADLFVEEDYMAGPSGVSWNYSMTATAISLAVSEMAKKSINLHIFVSNQVAYQTNLGTPDLNWATDFDPIKNANFAAARVPFFHYCLFANQYGGTASSGISRDIPASDFIISLGGITDLGWQTGTFLHELGHNIGLHHGGTTDDTNYKPNFVSIMNYEFQASGVWKDGEYQFLYSDITCNDINEGSLYEANGVTCATGSSSYWTRVCTDSDDWVEVNTNFDFNQDSTIESSPVSQDLNCDGYTETLIGGNDEYSALIFNGGSIGSASKRDVVDRQKNIYEPPIDEIPAPPANHFSPEFIASLKPHDGFQVLTSTNNFPPIIKSKDQAVDVKPVGFYAILNRHGSADAKLNTAAVHINVADIAQTTPVAVAVSELSDAAVNSDLFGRV